MYIRIARSGVGVHSRTSTHSPRSHQRQSTHTDHPDSLPSTAAGAGGKELETLFGTLAKLASDYSEAQGTAPTHADSTPTCAWVAEMLVQPILRVMRDRVRVRSRGLSPSSLPTALPKVDTICTAPSLIPTINGNTVRSFSTGTHGQQSAAQGSSTTVSRSDIRLIQHLDSSAHG